MSLGIANWSEFQHYRNRVPPWIKLHRELLDDPNWFRLPDASKALAPMLWLLASERLDGRIVLDLEDIAFRVRWDVEKVEKALEPLIARGFLTGSPGRDEPALASCSQNACPETEGEEETETEEEEEEESSTSPPATSSHSTSHDVLGARQRRERDARKQGTPGTARRGTRLPASWKPAPEDRQFAESLGVDADAVAAEFRDYWCGVPGTRGLKLDWSATFRNRCRGVGRPSAERLATARPSDVRAARDAAIAAALERSRSAIESELQGSEPA